MIHGSNQTKKQKKLQPVDRMHRTNQPNKNQKRKRKKKKTKNKKQKEKQKMVVWSCVKIEAKNKRKKKKSPMFQYLKSMYYIQDSILYIICLLCCSIWKIIKLKNANINIKIWKMKFINGLIFKYFMKLKYI